MVPRTERELGEVTGSGNVISAAVAAAVSGFIGIVTGFGIHGAKIDGIEDRLNRMETKLDRLVERHAWPEHDAR